MRSGNSNKDRSRVKERDFEMASVFLTNYTKESFLDHIKENLRTCNCFDFSVSFIKKAGLLLLRRDIEAALERGAKGRIITSTYQNFTDIESLRMFSRWMEKYPFFECHLDYECFVDEKNYDTLGYHSKGYLFAFEDHTETIVGSSNITRYALLKNIEWDVVLSEALGTNTVFSHALMEFEDKWRQTKSLNIEIMDLYANRLNFAIERWDMDYAMAEAVIKPNYMQKKALKELNRYRAMGVGKALVVASSGSGKTFLAAFDASNFNAQKLLYIVHEGSILEKSLQTFQLVFGGNRTYGLFAGGKKEFDADFLFATNISMASNLELFNPEQFDYVVIDECHRAAAETYRRIMGYFHPEFLIGLTATPERMDNQDVFDLFDQNVPFELRLRDAIINDLVVPFHYYGIRDQLVEYGLSPREEYKMIAQLAMEEHCEFIHQQIEKYREPGKKLKCLAFCRNVSHARMMAENMSVYYNTAYLTGKNNVGERIKAYNDLQSESSPLEILFTVDILNEGVDIPGVNMVLFLRPTESSTIFLQQLGRGLRKYTGKEYVTVLDFIGNSYKRCVQIAFALGSLSKNLVLEKKLIAQMISDDYAALDLSGNGVIIQFDDLSKEEFNYQLEQVNFNSARFVEQDYRNFKEYIGSETYPKHMDYLNNDCAPDLNRFINVKIGGIRTGSYYKFLKEIGEDSIPIFTEDQEACIKWASTYLPLVRPHEYLILQQLLKSESERETIIEKVKELLPPDSEKEIEHALTYMKEYVTVNQGKIRLNVERSGSFNRFMEDLLMYGLVQYHNTFGDETGFLLWHPYRLDQAQLKRCINPGYTALGTYYGDERDVYIFASLKKDAPREERLKYKDKYLDPNTFQWESRNNLGIVEKNKLLLSEKAYVFIRKSENEGGIVQPFIYVGTGKLKNPREQKENKSLLFDIHMDEVLPEELQYDFGVTDTYKTTKELA